MNTYWLGFATPILAVLALAIATAATRYGLRGLLDWIDRRFAPKCRGWRDVQPPELPRNLIENEDRHD